MTTNTMRALAFLGDGRAGLVDKPVPRPGAGEAVVRTTAALVCTSDVHTVRGAITIPAGWVLGHEAVGVVHELGDAVEGFEVGQRVAVGAITPCFRCGPCQRGFTSQCGGMLGGYKYTNQRDGNMSEYFLVNDVTANLAPIPGGLGDERAVYATDMLSTGFAGVEHAQLCLGESVAVFAQGPVGLAATIGARLAGAGLIITVEGRPERAELSTRFGADVVVDPGAGAVVEQVVALTDGGAGVDGAIEALGSPQTFEAAVRVTKPGGRISNIGYHGEDPAPLQVPLEPFGMGMGDKAITTSLCCPGGSERLGRLMRLMAGGRCDPTPMTTHEMGFDDIEHALDLMTTKADNIIKPLIRFPA